MGLKIASEKDQKKAADALYFERNPKGRKDQRGKAERDLVEGRVYIVPQKSRSNS